MCIPAVETVSTRINPSIELGANVITPSPQVNVPKLSTRGKAKAVAPTPSATYTPAPSSYQSQSSSSVSSSTPSTSTDRGLPAPFCHTQFSSNASASSSSTPSFNRGMPAMAGANAAVYQQSSLAKAAPTPQIRSAVPMYPSRLPMNSSDMYC